MLFGTAFGLGLVGDVEFVVPTPAAPVVPVVPVVPAVPLMPVVPGVVPVVLVAEFPFTVLVPLTSLVPAAPVVPAVASGFVPFTPVEVPVVPGSGRAGCRPGLTCSPHRAGSGCSSRTLTRNPRRARTGCTRGALASGRSGMCARRGTSTARTTCLCHRHSHRKQGCCCQNQQIPLHESLPGPMPALCFRGSIEILSLNQLDAIPLAEITQIESCRILGQGQAKSQLHLR